MIEVIKEYNHPVKIEVQGWMSDDGEIIIPESTIQVDLDDIDPPKEWADDKDTYILSHSKSHEQPIETTCGVARKLLENKT
jgi:hypothetical protein